MQIPKKKKAERLERVFCFLDDCIEIDCCKFSLSQREYLSSAVNLLTSSAKILDITKWDILQLYFPCSYEQIW